MAEDTTINGLSTALAATAAADDLLAIWDTSAGATKKHAAAYVARSDGASGNKLITGSGRELTVSATGTAALLATLQTFTAVQTLNAGISVKTVTLSATGGTSDLSAWTPITLGVFVLIDTTGGSSAIFAAKGGAADTVEMSDPDGQFSATIGTGSSINFDYDSGYKIRNNQAQDRTVGVLAFGI